MKGETKDLFADLNQPSLSAHAQTTAVNTAASGPASAGSSHKPTYSSAVFATAGVSTSGSPVNPGVNSPLRVDHMAATRRLRSKLRRAQAHSPEEVKAGRLICRHLLAMLHEAQIDAGHVAAGRLENAELAAARLSVASAGLSQRPQNDSVYRSGHSAAR